MISGTVGSILRSNQAYYDLICERQTLDYGIAFYSERFAGLPEANQFREVVIEREEDVPRAFASAETFFEDRGLTCRRWAPAEGGRIAGLAEHLAAHGFIEHLDEVLALARWVTVDRPPDVRVLPARAMRGAFEATFSAEGGPHAELEREAFVQRLDQPSMDMFVALVGGRAAGRCGLYEVGDIGRVMGLAVLPEFAALGVESALLAHVLGLAQRLAMRTICVQVPQDQAALKERLKALGFEPDGHIVEYHRRDSKEGP